MPPIRSLTERAFMGLRKTRKLYGRISREQLDIDLTEFLYACIDKADEYYSNSSVDSKRSRTSGPETRLPRKFSFEITGLPLSSSNSCLAFRAMRPPIFAAFRFSSKP